MPRTLSDHSLGNKIKDKEDDQWGIEKQNTRWPQQHTDLLIEGRLAGLAWATIAAKVNRGTKAVYTRFVNLCARAGIHYLPPVDWAPWRGRKHYDVWDNTVIFHATGTAGLLNGAYRPEYLSGILRRKTEAVAMHMNKIAMPGFIEKKKQGFFANAFKEESVTDPKQLAVHIHIVLSIVLENTGTLDVPMED